MRRLLPSQEQLWRWLGLLLLGTGLPLALLGLWLNHSDEPSLTTLLLLLLAIAAQPLLMARAVGQARRQGARAAEEQGRLFRCALDTMSDTVMIADDEQRIVYLNDSGQRFFKRQEAAIRQRLPEFNADELIGQPIDTFHHHSQRSGVSALQKSQTATLQFGRQVLRLVINPIRDSQGQHLGTVVEWSDRTHEKLLTEASQSMVLLTETIHANSNNAQSADDLSSNAYQKAERGQHAVAQAEAAMSAIADSSAEIAQLTTAIDELAFQTKLLALNASIEAARAGSSGSGFAVVAEEVNRLAQRFAHLARDIDQIVEQNHARISTGADLVRSAGTTLGEMVSTAQQVSRLVADIARASQEQIDDIERVSGHIADLNDASQAA